ncbi:MAPEG family protein [Alteromonas sp. H39]|uniref:MAPEG family protein n=1 Tax=Alteromonas sp. H39 TaxID=3389876 RepID=UPI0039E16983
MFLSYSFTLWGLWLILLTVVVQSLVAAVAHRKQSQYIPGKVDENLSHDSFVFRSHRTFHNSLENLAIFVLPIMLAIFAGAEPQTLTVIVWVYAIARIIHMALYYAIATEKNPSPRSYFYMIGLLATLAAYIVVALELLSRGA